MSNCWKKQHLYSKKGFYFEIIEIFCFIIEVFIGMYAGLKYGMNPTYAYEEYKSLHGEYLSYFWRRKCEKSVCPA